MATLTSSGVGKRKLLHHERAHGKPANDDRRITNRLDESGAVGRELGNGPRRRAFGGGFSHPARVEAEVAKAIGEGCELLRPAFTALITTRKPDDLDPLSLLHVVDAHVFQLQMVAFHKWRLLALEIGSPAFFGGGNSFAEVFGVTKIELDLRLSGGGLLEISRQSSAHGCPHLLH